jgi:hypothetical protein
VKQTDADLRRYYRIANKRYFGNKLPVHFHLQFGKIKGAGVTHVLNGDTPIAIEINETLRTFQAITILTVLHEMLHVEKPKDDHKKNDWRFDRRMLRLAQQGAFDGLW